MVSAEGPADTGRITRKAEPPSDPLITEPVADGSINHCGINPRERQAVAGAHRQPLDAIVLDEVGESLEPRTRSWLVGNCVAGLAGFGAVGWGELKNESE